MMVKYKYTEKYTREIISELLRIERTRGLTAENVVDEARNKSSPLHDIFEWNDLFAAMQHRLQQARVLINDIKVIVEDKEMFAFENVSVAVTENGLEQMQRMYKPVSEILTNKLLKRQVLLSALSHLEYWKDQYAKYNEFVPITKAIEKVSKQLKRKWQKKKK